MVPLPGSNFNTDINPEVVPGEENLKTCSLIEIWAIWDWFSDSICFNAVNDSFTSGKVGTSSPMACSGKSIA